MFSKSYKFINPLKAEEKLKLVYFNTRGRAELIRVILHTAGVNFVDERVEFEDWPKRKPETPFGTLPYLEIDGHKYGESLPIARFLARKYNLMGKTEVEQLSADAYLSLVQDVSAHFKQLKLDKTLTDEQKTALLAKIETEIIPNFCSKIEKALGESKSGFLIGSNVTIADLALIDIGEHALKDMPDVFAECPKISEHRQKITSLPKLVDYLANRPDSAM